MANGKDDEKKKKKQPGHQSIVVQDPLGITTGKNIKLEDIQDPSGSKARSNNVKADQRRNPPTVSNAKNNSASRNRSTRPTPPPSSRRPAHQGIVSIDPLGINAPPVTLETIPADPAGVRKSAQNRRDANRRSAPRTVANPTGKIGGAPAPTPTPTNTPTVVPQDRDPFERPPWDQPANQTPPPARKPSATATAPSRSTAPATTGGGSSASSPPKPVIETDTPVPDRVPVGQPPPQTDQSNVQTAPQTDQGMRQIETLPPLPQRPLRLPTPEEAGITATRGPATQRMIENIQGMSLGDEQKSPTAGRAKPIGTPAGIDIEETPTGTPPPPLPVPTVEPGAGGVQAPAVTGQSAPVDEAARQAELRRLGAAVPSPNLPANLPAPVRRMMQGPPEGQVIPTGPSAVLTFPGQNIDASQVEIDVPADPKAKTPARKVTVGSEAEAAKLDPVNGVKNYRLGVERRMQLRQPSSVMARSEEEARAMGPEALAQFKARATQDRPSISTAVTPRQLEEIPRTIDVKDAAGKVIRKIPVKPVAIVNGKEVFASSTTQRRQELEAIIDKESKSKDPGANERLRKAQEELRGLSNFYDKYGMSFDPRSQKTFIFQGKEVFVDDKQNVINLEGRNVGTIEDAMKDRQFAYEYRMDRARRLREKSLASNDRVGLAEANEQEKEAKLAWLRERPRDTKRNWKDFFKGLGLGALRGLAFGPGGIIGGALTGGIASAFNPDFDDQLQDQMFRYPKAIAELETAREGVKSAFETEKFRRENVKGELDLRTSLFDSYSKALKGSATYAAWVEGGGVLTAEMIAQINSDVGFDTGLKPGLAKNMQRIYMPNGQLAMIAPGGEITLASLTTAEGVQPVQYRSEQERVVTINGVPMVTTNKDAVNAVSRIIENNVNREFRASEGEKNREFQLYKIRYQRFIRGSIDRLKLADEILNQAGVSEELAGKIKGIRGRLSTVVDELIAKTTSPDEKDENGKPVTMDEIMIDAIPKLRETINSLKAEERRLRAELEELLAKESVSKNKLEVLRKREQEEGINLDEIPPPPAGYSGRSTSGTAVAPTANRGNQPTVSASSVDSVIRK